MQPERDVRVKRAPRSPITWGRVDLDAEVPVDHEVRAIAAVVDQLDLRGRYADVRARGEIAGAPATDPKILLGLWVYATCDGVGSGRMGTGDAKPIYKQRAATAETVNADAKAHRGMAATALRGLDQVTGSALSLRPHLQHPALHHREHVATLTFTVDRSSSDGRARSRPAPAYTPSSWRSPATKHCPARSQPTRGRRLIDVAVTAGLRSRAARRTMPKL